MFNICKKAKLLVTHFRNISVVSGSKENVFDSQIEKLNWIL
jgi:hypothetical protein